MPGKNAGRQGRTWRRIRAEVLAASDICHICGKPGSTTVDHYPISRADAIAMGRPDLLEDKTNLKPAHLRCNSSRGRGGHTRAGWTSSRW